MNVPNVETPWSPLPVNAVVELMRGAPFFWCLAGGHAIERVVGRPYRPHDDIDIVVLRPDHLALRQWLKDWHLAAADPPGSLRSWNDGETLPWRVHDLWGHRDGTEAWELQVMIQEADAGSWYFRRDDRVHGRVDDLAVTVDGVPCLRMDLQLLYKSKSSRQKDETDFHELLAILGETQRRTLADWLRLTSPNGHHWIPALEYWGV
jgi:hypothetical protein